MKIQKKLINHLMVDGGKETGEKILMKSFKELQKKTKKKSKEIFQLALIYSTPIFKLHKLKNKKRKKKTVKEIPGFIKNKEARTSLAIKFILLNSRNKNQSFYRKLNNEILLNAINKGSAVQSKNDLQKNVFTKKRFFLYYRWN